MALRGAARGFAPMRCTVMLPSVGARAARPCLTVTVNRSGFATMSDSRDKQSITEAKSAGFATSNSVANVEKSTDTALEVCLASARPGAAVGGPARHSGGGERRRAVGGRRGGGGHGVA